MRPEPDEVRAWFAGDLTDAELGRYLAILHADPNWTVDRQLWLHASTLTLFYAPGAAYVTLALWRDGAVWHPQLIPSCAQPAALSSPTATPAPPLAPQPPRADPGWGGGRHGCCPAVGNGRHAATGKEGRACTTRSWRSSTTTTHICAC